MKNLALLSLLAVTVCASSAVAAPRCDGTNGAAPTSSELEGCWTREVYSLLDAKMDDWSRKQAVECFSNWGRARLTVEAEWRQLNVYCSYGLGKQAGEFIAAIGTNELAAHDLALPNVADPAPSLLIVSKARDLGIAGLQGNALTDAVEQALLPPAVLDRALRMKEDEFKRAAQAARVQSFVKRELKF